MMRDRYCDHCGVRCARRWCYPCRKQRTIYGEAGLTEPHLLADAGSWQRQIQRWRFNDPAFRDACHRAHILVTCEAGDIVVEELQRPRRRRASFAIVKAFSKSNVHRSITRRLAAGRAAVAGRNYCNEGRAQVVSMRAWRAGIAHWMRRREGAGDGRPLRCRDTIECMTGAIVRCEKAIEPFLLDVERRARKRVREAIRMGFL